MGLLGVVIASVGLFDTTYTVPLSWKDAHFVDNIHTSAGVWGQPVESGTVDIWPNGGKEIQPGCTIISLLDLLDPFNSNKHTTHKIVFLSNCVFFSRISNFFQINSIN